MIADVVIINIHIVYLTRWRNPFKHASTDYSFKRLPFSLQYMAFYILKGGLLSCKRMPFACLSEISENRKEKPLKCNKLKEPA